MEARQVEAHYNARPIESAQTRRNSNIYHLRQFNNWLKNVLIALHTRPHASVLDLCCGKGGDLLKWVKARAAYYVGCDVARVSVEEAANRWNKLRGDRPFRPILLVGDCFAVRLADHLPDNTDTGDNTGDNNSDNARTFDVVSCQFAIHYAFDSEARVRNLLHNVADRLAPGGFFVGTTVDANVLIRKVRAVNDLEVANSVYRVRFDDSFASKRMPRGRKPDKKSPAAAATKKRKKTATARQNGSDGSANGKGGKDGGEEDEEEEENEEEDDDDEDNDEKDEKEMEKEEYYHPYGVRYHFTLDQSVEDCPEYVVHFPSFVELAKEFGLELSMFCNFHDFFVEFASDRYPEFRRSFFHMNVLDDNGSMPPDEWDAIYLYAAFAFRKVGDARARQPPEHTEWAHFDTDEIISMSADD